MLGEAADANYGENYSLLYEVTQREYHEITGTNPSNFSGDELPVDSISWLDDIAFCNAKSEKGGLNPVYTINGTSDTWDRTANGYRLPTEAEWEYACRAGTVTPFNTKNLPGADVWIHSGGTSMSNLWGGERDAFLEAMAEAASSVVDYFGEGERCIYINVMNRLSVDCDCDGNPAESDMHDIVPIAASFSRQGMKDDYLAAFMMFLELLNPQLLMYSTALGTTAVIVRFVCCLLCGVAAGLLVRVFYRDKGFFNFGGFAERLSHDTDSNPLLRLLKNIGRNIRATGPMFLIGIVLTTLYQIHVPNDFAASLFGGRNNGFGVLMAASIGVPFTCAEAARFRFCRSGCWTA